MAQTVIDVAVRTKGANELDKLQSRMLQLERQVATLQGQLPKAANGIRLFGASAAGATGGIRALGAAVQAALGPLAIAGGAVSALTAAFQTLSQQDFAEAKVRSLGTDSEELVGQLKKVSAELKGQASVVELTSAAYDVASAGFVNAADAAKVLKAASLGATGGFSDINTVGNAATSVLNAYGLSADHAAGLVDKFIQTQNDGKIVVAEYATNIGKVAAAAAGLGIPLSEVNAVIAQATASGVQADVAFTGLKGALARLASGEAAKELEGFGIKIDAASIEANGLYGTLKKLEGLDTGTLFKVLGTEAAPALLPVIQNLERFDELIKKQEGSAGAAARAQAEAANTIQGAWKSVQTAFSNFFAEQSALGDALKYSLIFIAKTVEITATAFNIMLAPLKAIIDLALQLGKAFDEFFGITQKIDAVKQRFDAFSEGVSGIFTDLTTTIGALWSGFLDELGVALQPLKQTWEDFTAGVATAWEETTTILGQYWSQTVSQITDLASTLGGFIQGVWNGIASGAQGIVAPITNAFRSAFDGAWRIIQGFWNSLPNWLKGALSAAASVAGGVASAVGNALNRVKGEIGKAISGSGKPAPAGGTGAVTKPAATATAPTGGGGGGGGGGGKGGGAVSQLPALQQELAIKQKLFEIDKQIQAAQLAGDKIAEQNLERKRIETELDGQIAKVQLEKLSSAEKAAKVDLARQAATEKIADLDFKIAKNEGDRKKRLDELLTGFDREIELAGIKNDDAKKLKQIEYEILDLKKQGVLVTDEEIKKYRERAQAAANAGKDRKGGKIQDYMDKLKNEFNDVEGQIVSLAQTIESEIGSAMSNAITGVIQGTQTVGDAFGQMFENIGKAFIDMATKMIAKALIMQVLGLLNGPKGPSSLVQGVDVPLSGMPAGMAFAQGGYPPVGKASVVGEKGPELFVPGQQGLIVPNDIFEATRQAISGGNDSKATAFDENREAMSNVTTIERERQMERFISSGAGSTEIRYSRVGSGDLPFVTEENMLQATRIAAQEGARLGQARTMAALKNNPGSRRSIGI